MILHTVDTKLTSLGTPTFKPNYQSNFSKTTCSKFHQITIMNIINEIPTLLDCHKATPFSLFEWRKVLKFPKKIHLPFIEVLMFLFWFLLQLKTWWMCILDIYMRISRVTLNHLYVYLFSLQVHNLSLNSMCAQN